MDKEKNIKLPIVEGYEFDDDDFKPVPREKRQADSVMDPVTPLWKNVVRTYCSNKLAVVALIIFIAVLLFGFIGPMFMPYEYDQVIRGAKFLSPSLEHPFGTDRLGRDLLVRSMYGVRISLIVGLLTTVMVLIIGTIYGAISGYVGGIADVIMMRIVEIIESVPIQLIILLMTVSLNEPISTLFDKLPDNFVTEMGAGMICILIAFALLYWTGLARIVRGCVMQLKNEEYVSAAISMGATGGSVTMSHLIPNSISQIVVNCTYLIKNAIFCEAFLSFIGMGVSVPMASLGTMINDARSDMMLYPFVMIFPVILIFLITWSLYVIGDGIRDALDPKMQQ